MSPRRASKWSVLMCGTALLGAGSLAVMAFEEPPAEVPDITSLLRCDSAPPTADQPAPPATQTAETPKPVVKPQVKFAPKPIGDAVKKGLEYLVQQQHENGGFGQGGGWRTGNEGQGGRVEGAEVKDPPDVGNTCIAALALIRAGNTPAKGPYSKQVAKAIEFVESHIEAADSESLYVTPIRDTQLQSKIGKYVDTFLAALVLSELKGQMPDEKSEKRLFAALNKTIGKIEKNQQADGTFAGNAGWASVLSQGLCSKALNRAFQKGVTVQARTLDTDFSQSVAALDSAKAGAAGAPTPAAGFAAGGRVSATAAPTAVTGPVPAEGLARTEAKLGSSARSAGAAGAFSDAGVSLYALSGNTARLQETANSNSLRMKKAEAVIADPKANEVSKREAEDELQQLKEIETTNGAAVAEVVTKLGDDRFLAGFGNNGGEEFLSYMNLSETLFVQGGEKWKEWDQKICATVEKVQNQDGSWSGHHCITGRTFCTSAALLTMLADRAPLPVVSTERPAVKTPAEAVESFKHNPMEQITVEFGVESAGWPDSPIPIGEDPLPPIMADWDGRLPNGGKFSLVLTAKAIRGLKDVGIDLPPAQPVGLVDQARLGVLCKHLKGKGVRVTGLVRATRPGERHTDYHIVVDDPVNFMINK